MRSMRMLLSVVLVALLASAAQAELIHQYTFNDGTANDSVGSVNGTLSGATVSGGKASFDGTDDYISFGSQIVPTSGVTGVTVVAWFNADASNAGSAQVFSLGVSASAGNWLFYIPTVSRIGIKTGSGSTLNAASTAQNDGKDHVVAAVITTTGGANNYGTLSYYLDGVFKSSVDLTSADNLSLLSGTTNSLAKGANGGDAYYKGTIDEFRVYNTALSATEISVLTSEVPEPSSTALLLTAIGGALAYAWRKKR
jgi:hypothetical protein